MYMQNEIYSLAPLHARFNPVWQPTYTSCSQSIGIKSCRGAREYISFVHVCMYST